MPLLKTLNFDPIATVYLWQIEESVDELLQSVVLHPSDQKRFDSLNHIDKQREFLALRSCLAQHFGENPEVLYYDSGKPYLATEEKLSFSHTKGYSAVIISRDLEVGLDLELFRPGIRKVARKYMREEEKHTILEGSDVEHLLYYWGAKEVMVKITGDRRLDFKKQLRVKPYSHREFQTSDGAVYYSDHHKPVRFIFRHVGELYITLGWEWNW